MCTTKGSKETDKEITRAFFHAPMLDKVHRRYELADPYLHNVVYLLDGTTIDVRMHHSQEGHKGRNANFRTMSRGNS